MLTGSGYNVRPLLEIWASSSQPESVPYALEPGSFGVVLRAIGAVGRLAARVI